MDEQEVVVVPPNAKLREAARQNGWRILEETA